MEDLMHSPQNSDILVSEENETIRETAPLNSCSRESGDRSKYSQDISIKTIKKPASSRKTCAFWTLVFLLFILAIGNLILTITIYGVLRIGSGLESLELLPEDQAIKFFGNVDLDHIIKQDGVVGGFDGENLEFTAEDAPLLLNLHTRLNRIINKLKIDRNETVFSGINSFEVKNEAQETIFSLNSPVFNNLKNANHLKSKRVEVNKIRSPTQEDLKIEGDRKVHLKGAEGAKIEGREIVWKADQDIYIKSDNGSIILSGKEGIYIDIKRIPIARLDAKSYVTAQFKICVCMPQGKLFRVPILNANDRVYCNQVNVSPQYNPCL